MNVSANKISLRTRTAAVCIGLLPSLGRSGLFVPYNEPDINWFSGLTSNASTLAAYEDEWRQTYQLIKGIWPQARVAGPNLTGYYPSTFSSFFAYCKANGCLPDVVTWHYALNV